MKRTIAPYLVTAAAGMGMFICASAAHASLVADGITYTLTETSSTVSAGTTTDDFTLGISGINTASDTEGGRTAVDAFAFNGAVSGWTETGPTGWTTHSGGLDSSGCDSSGKGYFCFAGNQNVSGSTMSLDFSISAAGSSAVAALNIWDPGFKIDWLGAQNNYDLVSETLTPGSTPPVRVPEPGSLALFGLALAMLGLMYRRRGAAGTR